MKQPISKLNSRGLSLMELMVAVTIMGIVSIGLMTFLDNSIASQNSVSFKAEADALTNEIRTTLGSTTACVNTFNSATPSALVVDAAMASLRTQVRDKSNSVVYSTTSTYGDRMLTLTTMSMGQYQDTVSTEGVAKLTLVYTATRRTLGPSTLAREIPIVTQRSGTALVNCYSKAAGSDSLWMAIGTTSVTAIYFANGYVGVGTPNPAAQLDVVNAANSAVYQVGASFSVTNNAGGTNYSRLFVGQNSTNAMFVEAADQANTKGSLLLQPWGGNVGIGTTTPIRLLEVTSSTGNWPQIIVNRTAAQFSGLGIHASGVRTAWLRYDHTNSIAMLATEVSAPLTLGTGAAERIRIDTSGNVGIGTATPAALLHVNGGGTINGSWDFRTGGVTNNAWIGVTNSVWGSNYLHIGGYGTAPNRFIGMWANITSINGGNVGIGMFTPAYPLDVAGIVRGGSFLSTSDRNEKESIQTAPGLELVSGLRGVSFRWKKDHKPFYGVIAQEVEEVLPELVATDLNGKKSVFYEGLLAPVIESIKELHVMCKMSETQSSQLAAQVESAERRIASLEEQVKLLSSRYEKQNSEIHELRSRLTKMEARRERK